MLQSCNTSNHSSSKPVAKPDVVYEKVCSLDVVKNPAKYLNNMLKSEQNLTSFLRWD